MRLLCILAAVVFSISITGCQTGPSETDKQIMKCLKEVNQKLTDINKQIKEIKEEAEEKSLPKISRHHFNPKKADFRSLRKIKLPKNPTREQVKQYIDKIILVSQGQNSFTSTDPQVGMFSRVGSENADLLFKHIKNHHVQSALSRIVTGKNKKQVLENLKTYPKLIDCVIKNNWLDDSKKIIFERLDSNGNGYLPQQWINVAVQIASPKEYGILEKYFINASNSQQNYDALCQLDGFDMNRAVAKAWRHKKRSNLEWQRKNMAMIAARFGHRDALKYLIHAYRIEKNRYHIGQMRTTLFQLTGQTLSPRKMLEWYNKNKGKLVFDSKSKEYVNKSNPKKRKVSKKPAKSINKGSDFRALRKIKLAKNPTKKQVTEYIKKIIAVSKGQKHFSTADPQIAMLCKVGSKNVDLLIDNIKNNHVCWALPRIITQKNKKQILEAFKKHHQLLSCVIEKGWFKEAKPTILKYLKKNNKVTGYSPQRWASAAIMVASPKDYVIIEDYFAHAGNPEMIFSILSQLDGLDMKKAAYKGWKYQKTKRKTYSKGNMAIIAAKYGHKDALKYMVYAKEKNQYLAGEMRTVLYELTGKTYSPARMKRWYKENEAKLVFDPENEEYIIKEKKK